MSNKFKELTESLDQEGLDQLRRALAEEVGERRQTSVIQMEHIQPGMTEAQKEAAMKEIARVLRGED